MRNALAIVCVCAALVGAALAAPGDPVVIDQGAEVRVAPRVDAPILKQLDEQLRAIERDRRGSWVEIEIPDLFVRGWLPAAGLTPGPQGDPSQGNPPEGNASNVPIPRLAIRDLEQPASPPPLPVAAAPRVPLARPDVADGTASGAGRLARLLEPPPPGLAVGPAAPLAAEPGAVERFRNSVRYLEARPETPRPMFDSVRWLRDGVVEITAAEGWIALSLDERRAWLATLFDRWLAASGWLGTLRLQIRDPGGDIMTRVGP